MKKQLKRNIDLTINIFYLSVQTILILGSVSIIWQAYIWLNLVENAQDANSPALFRMRITLQVCLLLTTFVSFGVIVDSLLRVRRFSVGTLVISKKLMYYHFAAFGIFTLSVILAVLTLNSHNIFTHLDPSR